MSQLGAGFGSSYPYEIDTRQTFINSPQAAPDSASRVDSEVINDILETLQALQITLGAMPQGVYGSVAARLQQFLPGGGSTPALFGFASQQEVVIPGSQHRLGSATLFVQVYDDSVPAAALRPGDIAIDQLTYDVSVTFAGAQTGTVTLAASAPSYTQAFTNETTVTILGSTHGLPTSALLVEVFTNESRWHVLAPASMRIDQTTRDVTVTFLDAESGSVIVSAAGPRYVTTFTNATTVTVLGTTHGLATKALLFQVFDAQTPAQIIHPNTLTVAPGTYDVVLTFLSPQSGTLLLVQVPDISGSEFTIQDSGIPDNTATRVYSDTGTLNLQAGAGDATVFRDRLGQGLMTLLNTGRLGLGVANPTGQLELSTDVARKLATATWETTSDARLKTVLGLYTDGLDLVRQLAPIWFQYNGLGGIAFDGQRHVGLLAQDVQPLAPYMVSRKPGHLTPDTPQTELLTLNPHALTYMCINAIQTLAHLNDALTARVAALEARLSLEGESSVTPP